MAIKKCCYCGRYYATRNSSCPYCMGRTQTPSSMANNITRKPYTGRCIITSTNYIPGYDIIEIGQPIHDVFNKFNIAPHGELNRFIAAITNEREKLTREANMKAEERMRQIANRGRWNAILNFEVWFEEVGEWASINCVNVHFSGVPCVIVSK